MFVLSCSGGPDKAPRTYRSKPGQNFAQQIEWEPMETNQALQEHLKDLEFINQEMF